MLREVLIVEQNNPALKRRWFESDYFDLFIWQDAGGAFVRFQLCYDVELNERALLRSVPEGFYGDPYRRHPAIVFSYTEHRNHRDQHSLRAFRSETLHLAEPLRFRNPAVLDSYDLVYDTRGTLKAAK